MLKRALPFVLFAAACGGSSPAATGPSTAIAPPDASPPPAPPRVAKPAIELEPIGTEVRFARFTVAPEPDLVAVVKPLLGREAQRRWGVFESAQRDASTEPPRDRSDALFTDARRALREPLCGRNDPQRPVPPDPLAKLVPAEPARATERPATPPRKGAADRARAARGDLIKELEQAIALVPERAPASLVALAYLEEEMPLVDPPPSSDDTAHARERAASLYRRAKERTTADTPLGWLARYRLAGLLDRSDAPAEYDALLDAPLATPLVRGWARALIARPLQDWSKAAGVLRAVTLSAPAPTEKLAVRAEWLVATYNAGGWRESLDLATDLLGEPPYPHVALDVAMLAIERLGGLDKVSLDLPSASFATLMLHVAWAGMNDGDLVAAERAARGVMDRAPEAAEAPVAAFILASVQARRGDRAGAESRIAAARSVYSAHSPWGDRLRASRGKLGYPSDAEIEALTSTLGEALPEPPATDEERKDDVSRRLTGLAARCLSHPRVAGDPGADGAQIAIAIDVFDAGPPDVTARATAGGGGIVLGLACLRARAGAFFDAAPASVRATFAVSR